MNRQPFEKPPRWWPPKLSRRWVRFWRFFRHREQHKKHRLLEIEVRGADAVRRLLADGCGVLITPNHCSHADCFSLYEAADRLGCPIYAMVAWQVFQRSGRLRQLALQHHGCFSIDREGTDLAALRKAREVLQSEPYPLVIFPEGDVYHLNDRITPFREGPAAIALMAARKAARPIACVPCAMKYRYVLDVMPELLDLMDRLERTLHWRPRPDLSLSQRIYHIAEGMLALKEVEIVGRTNAGPLPDRIAELMEFLLSRIESRYGLSATGSTVPERVKAARQYLIKRLQEIPAEDPSRNELHDDLDDLFLVVQAFSYPGDYVREQPSVERMAETLDKFEEDLLGVKTATVRAARKSTVVFGEPIVLDSQGAQPMKPATVTRMLEERVQNLLDQIAAELSRP